MGGNEHRRWGEAGRRAFLVSLQALLTCLGEVRRESVTDR